MRREIKILTKLRVVLTSVRYCRAQLSLYIVTHLYMCFLIGCAVCVWKLVEECCLEWF